MSAASERPGAPRNDDGGDGGAHERAPGTSAPARPGRAAGGHTARRRMHRRRAARRRRRLVAATASLLALAIVAALALARGGARRRRSRITGTVASRALRRHPVAASRRASYAVGLELLRLVEPGRTVTFRNGVSEPRTLETYIRYPAEGPTRNVDVAGAPPARSGGPFPLIVFGHGYEETPETYKLLLESWARAGFVVAAPGFPLEDADAPGGSDESDLVNEPSDMRFVISHILAESESGSGRLAGLVRPDEVAVAGQSDGGDSALATGYGHQRRDSRVKAVIVLSGAEGPFHQGIEFPFGSPALLATQGTADTVNRPSETMEYFNVARAPKYLLTLAGAEHLPPYTYEQPQLETVERVTITFLYAYLEHKAAALRRLPAVGDVAGVATLASDVSTASSRG